MLWEMAKAMQSLANTPFNAALDQARRHMPRSLADGGVVPALSPAAIGPGDYAIPVNTDLHAVADAIETHLMWMRLPHLLGAAAVVRFDMHGRPFVPADYVHLLGHGSAAEGRRVLDRVVNAVIGPVSE